MSGIVNLGANCYTSAVLQLIASHSFCAQIFYNHVKSGHCQATLEDCLKCTLAKVFSTITQTTNHVINTDETLSMLRLLNVDYREQGDPREFLSLLIRERIPALQTFFSFSEKTVQQCTKCQYVSTSESQVNIYFTIPRTTKINEAIKDCLDKNFLPDYQCTRCAAVGESYQERILLNVPDFLFIHVTGAVMMDDIDLYFKIKEKNFIMLGLIEYKPKSGSRVLSANHYVAWKRFKAGVWVQYDDEKVSLCLSPQKIRPYLLLYRTTGGADFEDQIELDKLIKHPKVAKVEKKEKLYYHLLGTLRLEDNKALYLKDAPNRRKKQKKPDGNTQIPLEGDDYQEIKRLLQQQGKEGTTNGNPPDPVHDPNNQNEDPDKTIEYSHGEDPDGGNTGQPGGQPTKEPEPGEPEGYPAKEPERGEPQEDPAKEPEPGEPNADPGKSPQPEHPKKPKGKKKPKKDPKVIPPKKKKITKKKTVRGQKRKAPVKDPGEPKKKKPCKGKGSKKKISDPKVKKRKSSVATKKGKSILKKYVAKNPRKDGKSQRLKKYAKYDVQERGNKKHISHLLRSDKDIIVKSQKIPGHCVLCPKQFFGHEEKLFREHYLAVHHKYKVRINNIVYLRCKCSVVPNRGTDGSVRNAHYHCYACMKPCDKKYQLAIHVIDKHDYAPNSVSTLFTTKKK